MLNRIKVELVDTNFFTRWPCTVCGGCTEKVDVLAEAESDDIRVCETCLEAGNIDKRLKAHAVQMPNRAEFLNSLVGRLDVPTFADWQDRMKVAEEQWEEYQKQGPRVVATRMTTEEAPF